MPVKLNKAAIIKACKAIEKKEGEGSVFQLGSAKANLKIHRWSTGIEDLDHILGGGMPEGRIVEIFGAESSGKTSLAYHLCALHELALNIPIEGTFDAKRAASFGNKKGQMLIYRAKYGEQALNRAMDFGEAGCPIIVIDSIPSCIPKVDMDKARKDLEDGTGIGGIARLMGKALPPLEEIIEITGTTVILINQIRDKMNAMMFGEKTDTPGGHKLRHACSVRIQVSRKAWIDIPNKDAKNSATTEKIGLIMKVKVVKSKVCNPMGEAEIPMFFDRGFVSFNDIAKIRQEHMKARGAKVGIDDDEEDED